MLGVEPLLQEVDVSPRRLDGRLEGRLGRLVRQVLLSGVRAEVLEVEHRLRRLRARLLPQKSRDVELGGREVALGALVRVASHLALLDRCSPCFGARRVRSRACGLLVKLDCHVQVRVRLLGVLGEVDDLAVVVGRRLVRELGADVVGRGVLRLLRHARDERAVGVVVGVADEAGVARLPRVHADWRLRGGDVVQGSGELVAVLAEVVEVAAPLRVVLVR